MTPGKPTRAIPWLIAVGAAFAIAKYPHIQSAIIVWFPGLWLEVGRNWLSNKGWHRTAGYYGLIMIHGPDLVIVFLVGLVYALALSKRGIWLAVFFVLSYKFFEGVLYCGDYSVSDSLHIGLISSCVVLPAAVGGAFFGSFLRRYVPKEENDRCYYCSYDLTGNTSGVCPECGQPTTNAA